MRVKREEYIIDRLQPIIKSIGDSVSFINAGGCGIFARALSDKLNVLGIENSFVGYCNYDREDLSEWEKFLMGRPADLKVCVPSHIVVKTDFGYLDSEGNADDKIEAKLEYDVPLITYTREQLDLLIDKGGWNPMFNRDTGTPAIEVMLDIALIYIQEDLMKNNYEQLYPI